MVELSRRPWRLPSSHLYIEYFLAIGRTSGAWQVVVVSLYISLFESLLVAFVLLIITNHLSSSFYQRALSYHTVLSASQIYCLYEIIVDSIQKLHISAFESFKATQNTSFYTYPSCPVINFESSSLRLERDGVPSALQNQSPDNLKL